MELNLKDLAYCGLYCPQCSFQVAGETGDMAHMHAMPARYDRFKTQTPAQVACPGCKTEQSACGDCEMRDCAGARGLDCCADCGDFPCETTRAFGADGQPHHKLAFETSLEIQAIGKDAWFQKHQATLACAQCGERLSWYYGCPRHGGGLCE